jgi:Uma2 family endonuclease
VSSTLPAAQRLSLEEYEALVREGRLESGPAVELLDGLLVTKMSKNPRHAAATRRIYGLLRELLPAGFTAFKEDPVRLPVEGRQGGGSEPEPDVVVVAGEESNFEVRHPDPGEVRLIVEVSSDARRLREDREGLARYARNRIAQVWIVNLPAGVVEIYTQPSGPGDEVYEINAVARPGDVLTLDLGAGHDGGRVEIRLAVVELLA